MRIRLRLLLPAALAAVCVACGSDTGTPATGGGAGAGAGAPSCNQPARGSLCGEIVLISGNRGTVEAPDGSDATFTVSRTTSVVQYITTGISDLVVGQCAFAQGEKDIRGYVVAVAVTVTAHGANGCVRPATGGIGAVRHGVGAGGSGRTGGRANASGLSFAGGKITSVSSDSGLVFTVQGPDGEQRFTAGPTTPVRRFYLGDLGSVHRGDCVSVRGIADSTGRVAASSIRIVPAAVNGCFTGGASDVGGS